MALRSADEAIELDALLADGYSSRGIITAQIGGNIDAAEADFARANELAPNNPNAAIWSIRVLAQRGESRQGYTEAQRAVGPNPFHAGRRMSVVGLAFLLDDYDVVIDEARAAADLAPGLSLATSYEGRALALTGQGTACLARELGVYDLVRAICLHTAGREAEAAQLAKEAGLALSSSGMSDTYHMDDMAIQDLASYYGLVGDAPNATLWLRRAFDLSPTGIDFWTLNSELFDAVRSDVDFADAVVEVDREAIAKVAALR